MALSMLCRRPITYADYVHQHDIIALPIQPAVNNILLTALRAASMLYLCIKTFIIYNYTSYAFLCVQETVKYVLSTLDTVSIVCSCLLCIC